MGNEAVPKTSHLDTHIQRRLSAATLLLSELHSHRPGLENTVFKDHMWCFGPNDRLTSESWSYVTVFIKQMDGGLINTVLLKYIETDMIFI